MPGMPVTVDVLGAHPDLIDLVVASILMSLGMIMVGWPPGLTP